MFCAFGVIPSNIPFVIQRDVLVSEQSDRRRDSLQTYITAVGRFSCGAFERPMLLFVVHLIPTLHRTVTLRVSDFTLKCIGVFVVHLNIIERSSQLRVLLKSY